MSVSKTLNKVKRALDAKGRMPLINTEQFYGDEGQAITKYILHDGNPGKNNNNAIDVVYGKLNLLKSLVKILKEGEDDE